MTFELGQTVGHYLVTDQLGQGGMATVYRARDIKLDRDVALKVLHQAFKADPNFTERFNREARIVANLSHDNIVPIFDTGEDSNQPFLVMKFIDGETLKARMSRGALSVAESIKIIDAVASALTYAHGTGILHRDIKPSNILLEQGSGKPYLADFGLARMADAGESTMSQDVMLGTPHYISPEQAQGVRDLNASTDIYSLGVVLYEIMVGRVPFVADTPYAIVHDHIFAPLPLPSKVNPMVPKAVEDVLLRALAKNREDRYPSAVEMADAFKEAIQASGLEAMPSGAYRVPLPVDSRVTAGSTILETPRPSTNSGQRTPTIPMPAAISVNEQLLTDQLRSLSELRHIQQRKRQRANLWVFVGVAGLILTCLAGTIVTVGAFADPLVRASLLITQPDGTPGDNDFVFDTNPTLAAQITTTPAAQRTRPGLIRTPNQTAEAMVQIFLDPNSSNKVRENAAKTLYNRANSVKTPADVIFFQSLAAQGKGSGEAQALAALATYRVGETKTADRYLEAALSLAPESPYVLLFDGIISKEAGKTDVAKRALTAATTTSNAPGWVVDEATRLLKEMT